MNMNKICCGLILGFFILRAHASILVQFDFNDEAGTELQQVLPTIGNNWGSSFAHPVSGVDGSGNFVISGNFVSTDTNPLTSSFNTASTTDIYELSFTGVTFQNLSGNDYIVFAYRTSNSGTALPGSSSTRAWLKFGDFAGSTGSIDIEAGPDSNNTQRTGTDLLSTANTFDFITQWDTNNDVLRFYYDAGAGRVQIGSDLTSVDGTISHIGMYGNVSDGGAGDSISIDGISLVAIPEPGTLALVGIALGVLMLFRSRR